VHCDVTSEDEIGRHAISVHCGGEGIAQRTVSRDGTPHALDAFRRTVELNLVGTFNVFAARRGADVDQRTRGGDERGVCVRTASIDSYESQIGQVSYGSAKAGNRHRA